MCDTNWTRYNMGTTVSHHGGTVVLLLMSVICWEILSTAVQGALKSSCTRLATGLQLSSVNLTCNDSNFSWFHVIQMVHSLNSTDNCSPLTNGTNKIRFSRNQLISPPLCIGKQHNNIKTCTEHVTSVSEECLNGTQFVSVDYECVNESLNYNMCEDKSLEMTGDVYLASPGMFGQHVSRSLCRCHVKAAGLQLQALYISLNDSSQLNITCQQCSFNPLRYIVALVNINVITDTSKNTTYTLDMDFYDFISNASTALRNRVWLKISGTQKINVQCNGGITSTLPSSTASSTTPTSETTTNTTTKTTTQNEMSTDAATSRQTSRAISSDSSTMGSAGVTSASSTSTLVPTTQNSTAQSDTPTSTLTSERTTAPNSPDGTLELTVVTTTSFESSSSTYNVTSLVAASLSVAGVSRDTVAYIIGGVVGGVAVLVCGVIIVVIICRWRRRQAKEDIHGLYAVSPETAETNSLEPNLTVSSHKPFGPAYCEVDLDDEELQQDHPGATKYCLQNGQSTFAIDKTDTAHTNGWSPQADQTILMTTFQMKQKVKVDNSSAARDRPGQNETENKNFYFILEPEHEAAGDADSAGVSGSVTQASHAVAAEKTAEDFDDESYHYYSQIKDNEEAPTAGHAIASKDASSSRREKKPFSIGDYEEVDLSDTKDEDDDDSEELIMMDNVAYVSADHDVNDAGAAAADDELVMLDNAAYVSAGPPNENHHESEDNDDSVELIMMDNVANVSAGPPGSGHSKTDLNSTITAADASATRNDHHDDGGDTSANFDNDSAPADHSHEDQKDEEAGEGYYSTIKDSDNDSSDDELKMLDNVVYVSYGSGGGHTSIV